MPHPQNQRQAHDPTDRNPVSIADLTATISIKLATAVKQWMYETCEKLSPSHSIGRVLAFNSTQLWEFLSCYIPPPQKLFTIPFCPKYAQLYGLIAINTCLMEIVPLQKRYVGQDILSLSHDAFPQPLVYGLQQDILGLNRSELIKKPTLLKYLEDLLAILPQTVQIRNVSLILLDAFNLKYFSPSVNGPKVAAAALAVTRFWVMESDVEKWPSNYEMLTNLKIGGDDTAANFKEQYDLMYAVAYEINQRNIAQKLAAGNQSQPVSQVN